MAGGVRHVRAALPAMPQAQHQSRHLAPHSKAQPQRNFAERSLPLNTGLQKATAKPQPCSHPSPLRPQPGNLLATGVHPGSLSPTSTGPQNTHSPVKVLKEGEEEVASHGAESAGATCWALPRATLPDTHGTHGGTGLGSGHCTPTPRGSHKAAWTPASPCLPGPLLRPRPAPRPCGVGGGTRAPRPMPGQQTKSSRPCRQDVQGWRSVMAGPPWALQEASLVSNPPPATAKNISRRSEDRAPPGHLSRSTSPSPVWVPYSQVQFLGANHGPAFQESRHRHHPLRMRPPLAVDSAWRCLPPLPPTRGPHARELTRRPLTLEIRRVLLLIRSSTTTRQSDVTALPG